MLVGIPSNHDVPKTPNATRNAALGPFREETPQWTRGVCLHLTTFRTDPAVRNK